ncbi:cell division protein FtsI [Nonomuraea sp. KC401]|uniref:penicillin-binding transpeptidase domain-containing protein n=1 Tax=unclassified Nonomuraea TaxID=2593643 RepID=UPI0010FE2EC0|nr:MULTISPECIES: penicillin-binding transpeptidase domain-containing protein [unclassified Nonomuraea]NBE94262.1 cell division protein FtsI [Nonomuraea sp. K271]TLF66062.1 cell division protein FtsI [Nonomuraea sp. KC401]
MAPQTGTNYAYLRPEHPPRRRGRRRSWIVAGLLVPVVVAGGVIWALRTQGSPEQTADEYLAAWSGQDYAAMRDLVADPPADFERRHRRFLADLKATRTGFHRTEPSGDGPVGFVATLTGEHDWRYSGQLKLVESGRTWKVAWSPATLHPLLQEGRSLRVITEQADPPRVVAADGTTVSTPDAPGSVQQLVEGIKQTIPDRFATPRRSRIDLYEGGKALRTVVKPERDRPLRTTIDLKVHQAAARALEGVSKPRSLVALRASTGEILAAVNAPGGFNRALLGKYPPGSTFKVVTASALVADGTEPAQRVACPAERNIGGFPFHNAGYEDFGTLSFRDAFAHSCNTTFGELAVAELDGGRLGEVAGSFGFGVPITPGAPAVRAEFPGPKDDTDLASAAIGQGRVLASPLNMASVAAAIASGAYIPPTLVKDERIPGAQPSRPRPLEKGVVAALRDLMPAVVTDGTANAVRFPPGTAGKTGTAEYGSGEEPPAHSWFIGYKGDLAFAVVVEGGGAGSAVAAPIAARFLSALP